MVYGPGESADLPTNSVSLNGTDEQALERYKIRELCEGFPCHRDACEWTKMRALFADEAYVFTTWSGGVSIEDFIKVSIQGYKNGAHIMHKACGVTVDVATSGPGAGKRGVGKMKAIITQRFTAPAEKGGDCLVDVECQCRLCFFVEKNAQGEWKAKYFKGFYEKDKVIPVDPRKIPVIDDAKLETFPEGYAYLAYFQSTNNKILMDLPRRRGEEHDHFYVTMIKWLNGEDITKDIGIGGK